MTSTGWQEQQCGIVSDQCGPQRKISYGGHGIYRHASMKNNIYWANRLQEEGVQVIYGVNKLKVHAKLCLVRESVGNRTLHYASIGTGNFNEETARLYTDIMLMTTRPSVVSDQVFNFFDNQYDIGCL